MIRVGLILLNLNSMCWIAWKYNRDKEERGDTFPVCLRFAESARARGQHPVRSHICVYIWQRRLASISGEEEGTDYTYTYNSDGIRTSKTVNGVEHIYHLSGTQILSEEWTENGVQHLLIYIYDASGDPMIPTDMLLTLCFQTRDCLVHRSVLLSLVAAAPCSHHHIFIMTFTILK